MYSLTRTCTSQHARIVSGIRNVVSKTKSTLIPSTPTRYFNPISQSRSSTNWKPGLPGSNSARMNSEIRKVTDVAIIASHLAFLRAASSSPRRKIARIAAATSGRKVTMERTLAISSLPAQRHPGHQDHDAQHHGKGVVEEVSALRPTREPGEERHDAHRQPVYAAVDHVAVAAPPQKAAKVLGGTGEDDVIDLVEVPLVQQEAVEDRLVLGQPARQRRPGDIEKVGQRESDQHGEERRDLDPGGRVMGVVHHVIVGMGENRALPGRPSGNGRPVVGGSGGFGMGFRGVAVAVADRFGHGGNRARGITLCGLFDRRGDAFAVAVGGGGVRLGMTRVSLGGMVHRHAVEFVDLVVVAEETAEPDHAGEASRRRPARPAAPASSSAISWAWSWVCLSPRGSP